MVKIKKEHIIKLSMLWLIFLLLSSVCAEGTGQLLEDDSVQNDDDNNLNVDPKDNSENEGILSKIISNLIPTVITGAAILSALYIKGKEALPWTVAIGVANYIYNNYIRSGVVSDDADSLKTNMTNPDISDSQLNIESQKKSKPKISNHNNKNETLSSSKDLVSENKGIIKYAPPKEETKKRFLEKGQNLEESQIQEDANEVKGNEKEIGFDKEGEEARLLLKTLQKKKERIDVNVTIFEKSTGDKVFVGLENVEEWVDNIINSYDPSLQKTIIKRQKHSENLYIDTKTNERYDSEPLVAKSKSKFFPSYFFNSGLFFTKVDKIEKLIKAKYMINMYIDVSDSMRSIAKPGIIGGPYGVGLSDSGYRFYQKANKLLKKIDKEIEHKYKELKAYAIKRSKLYAKFGDYVPRPIKNDVMPCLSQLKERITSSSSYKRVYPSKTGVLVNICNFKEAPIIDAVLEDNLNMITNEEKKLLSGPKITINEINESDIEFKSFLKSGVEVNEDNLLEYAAINPNSIKNRRLLEELDNGNLMKSSVSYAKYTKKIRFINMLEGRGIIFYGNTLFSFLLIDHDRESELNMFIKYFTSMNNLLDFTLSSSDKFSNKGPNITSTKEFYSNFINRSLNYSQYLYGYNGVGCYEHPFANDDITKNYAVFLRKINEDRGNGYITTNSAINLVKNLGEYRNLEDDEYEYWCRELGNVEKKYEAYDFVENLKNDLKLEGYGPEGIVMATGESIPQATEKTENSWFMKNIRNIFKVAAATGVVGVVIYALKMGYDYFNGVEDDSDNQTVNTSYEAEVETKTILTSTIKGDTITYTVNLVDEESNPLKYQNLELFINNAKVADFKTDQNGKATCTFKASRNGTYTSGIRFEETTKGNIRYHSSYMITTDVIGEDKPKIVDIKTQSSLTSTKKGNTITYTLSLVDNENKPLKDQSLELIINQDKPINLKTDKNGKTTYTHTTRTPGTYKAIINYKETKKGNTKYQKSTTTNTITLNKKDIPKITNIQTKTKLTSKIKGNTITYTLSLLDNKNKPLSGENIQLLINKGKTINLKTDKNGKATYTLNTKPGKYKATINYKEKTIGNTKYQKSTSTKTDEIKKPKKPKGAVKKLQKFLKNKKCYTGKIDGIYGKMVKKAEQICKKRGQTYRG